MQPLFSVVIPTYNRWPLVHEAVESALAQTWQDFETIVVDDGSQDGSVEALRQRYGGRISIIEKANGGVSTARNVGIAAARGTYIAYLDSDDLWLPEKLAAFAEAIQQRKDPVAFYFSDFRRYEMRSARFYPESNTELFPRIFKYFTASTPGVFQAEGLDALSCVAADYPFFPSTFVLHRELHDHFRWDPSVRYSEDFNFVSKIADRYPMVYIDQALSTVRMHASNKSANWLAKLESHIDTLQILERRVGTQPQKKRVVQRARGRRHLSAARQLLAEHRFLPAVSHASSALSLPNYWASALKDLIRGSSTLSTRSPGEARQASRSL